MENHVDQDDLDEYLADTLNTGHTSLLVEAHVAKCARCASALGTAVRKVVDAQLAKLEEGQRMIDALRKKVDKALGRTIN